MRRTPWIIGLIASALIGVRAIAGDEAPSPPEVILAAEVHHRIFALDPGGFQPDRPDPGVPGPAG